MLIWSERKSPCVNRLLSISIGVHWQNLLGLLMSTKHTTELTREYYCSSIITYEYKSTPQELHASIYNSSVITCEQCIPHVAWV